MREVGLFASSGSRRDAMDPPALEPAPFAAGIPWYGPCWGASDASSRWNPRQRRNRGRAPRVSRLRRGSPAGTALRRAEDGSASACRVSAASGAGRGHPRRAETRGGVDRRRVDLARPALGVEAGSMGRAARQRSVFAVDLGTRRTRHVLRRGGPLEGRSRGRPTRSSGARDRAPARWCGHQSGGRRGPSGTDRSAGCSAALVEGSADRGGRARDAIGRDADGYGAKVGRRAAPRGRCTARRRFA